MNIEKLRSSWRPAMGWAMVIINLLYAMVICFLLLSRMVSFGEVLPFLLTQIGQLTVVGTITAVGRTYEKRHGKAGEVPLGSVPGRPDQ